MTEDRLERLDRVKGVLFDLDGTLLQVDMADFIPAYIEKMAAHFADVTQHLAFSRVIKAVTLALIRSADGTITNEEWFYSAVEGQLGIKGSLFHQRLQRFYLDGLTDLSGLVRPLPLARDILNHCFERGLKVVIATNPVFPREVVEARLEWGGISDFPYDLVTSFENCRYCKPHPGYFHDVLKHIGLTSGEVVMIGNDTEHDLGARDVGIQAFLVDTWLVDRLGGTFQADFRGDHLDLFRFLGRLVKAGP